MASFRSTTGTLVRASAAELNLLDDTTAATSTTVVAVDRVVFNDDNVGMKQVGMTDLTTYFDGSTAANVYTPTAINGTGTYTGIPHVSTDKVLVHVNGVLLASGDVTKTPASSSVQFPAITADDITILVISKLSTESTTITVDRPTAVATSNAYTIAGGVNNGDDVFVYVNGVLYDNSDVTLDYVNNTATFTCSSTSDDITIQTVRAIETNSHTVLRNHRFVSSSSTPPAAGSTDFPVPHGAGDTINAYVNGILLDSANVTSVAATNIITLSCEDSSDEVLIQVIGAINTNQHQTLRVYRPTAVASSNAYTGIAHSTADTVLVYINGVLLNNNATSPNGVTTNPVASTVTFTATNVADEITILVTGMVNTAEHTSVRTYYPTAVASSNAYSGIAHDSVDKIFVYRNGVLLDDGDVENSPSASTVTFTALANDEITIQVMGALTTSGIAEYTPTALGTTNGVYSVNHNTIDIVNVYLNGVLLDAADYSTSPSNNTVTVTTVAGDVLKIQVIGSVSNMVSNLAAHPGSIIPSTTTTYDLGSASKKWNNLYTADLHLSNEGAGGNSIDGTVGNWSIQEGNENLFLLNNSNGKKYKFKLEEVV